MSRPQLKLVGAKKSTITQADMREFWRLGNQIADLTARRAALQQRYVMLMNGGVGQEAGKFRLIKKGRTIRRVAWKEHFIEARGQKAADAILRHAKPKTYYKLSFEDIVNE